VTPEREKRWGGLIDFLVLFFIHVGTRRVYLAGMTVSPNSACVAPQARNLAMYVGDWPVKPALLIRDWDTKFTAEFDGIEIKRVGPRAPNMNAIAER
jgi:putative transposase